MDVLIQVQTKMVSAGVSILNVATSAVMGGVVEGVLAAAVMGPGGFAVGFSRGVYEGAAGALIAEGAFGLTDTLHAQSAKKSATRK